MNQFELTFKVNMESLSKPQGLDAPLIYNDRRAHRISVELYSKGIKMEPRPPIIGTFVPASGENISLGGGVMNDKVYVDLPAECYAVPGPFTLYIHQIEPAIDQRTTLLKLTGMIDQRVAPATIDGGNHFQIGYEEAIAKLDSYKSTLTQIQTWLTNTELTQAELAAVLKEVYQ